MAYQQRTTATCTDCGVRIGVTHQDGCDVATCTETGTQQLTCNFERELNGKPPHACRNDTWTGLWPGEAECVEFGWFVQDRCAEGLGFVRCGRDSPRARPDLSRLKTDARWDNHAHRWVKR